MYDKDKGFLFFWQFPNCSDEEIISVACLDLHYYVTVHKYKKCKEEETDISIEKQDRDGDKNKVCTRQINIESWLMLYLYSLCVITVLTSIA